MELILGLFQAYVAGKEAAQAYTNVTEWVIDVLSRWGRKTPTDAIGTQIKTMAKSSDSDVDKLLKKAAEMAKGGPISPERLAELIRVLKTLSRGVRQRSHSLGIGGISFRSTRSLEDIFAGIEPARSKGQPVAKGSPWILQRMLGIGSFGEVWMAVNKGYPTPRAYKFFTRDSSGEWLRREQDNLTANLKLLGKDDGIVGFIDVQVDDCEYPYLTLEYLGGGSLEEWIYDKEGTRRAKLEPGEIIRQVVVALAAAHAQGIAHRDIKPANLLLTEGPDPRVKIGDFGLARVAGAAVGSQLASLAGLVGTEIYLPPDALQRGARIDPYQADVFAVGVVWYQLMVEAIERPCYDFAERLRSRGLDSHAIRLIERCLANPSRRFHNAGELLDALSDSLPPLEVCPPGTPDVQHIAREYLSTLAR